MNSKKLAVGSFLIFIPSLIVHFTQIYIVSKFGFDFKGEFEFYNSILLLSSSIFSINIYTALTLFVSKQNTLPGNLKFLSFITGLPQVIFSILILSYYKILDDFLIIKIILISIAVYLNHLTNIRISILNGFQKLLLSKFILILGPLFTLFFLFFAPYNHLLIIFIFVLPFLVNFIFSEFIKFRYINNYTFSSAEFHLFNMTWKVFLISIFQILYQRLFLLYIISRVDLKEIGSFSLASTFSQMLLIPVTFITLSIISSDVFSQKSFLRHLSFSFLFLIGITVFSIVCIVNLSYIKGFIPILDDFSFLKNGNFLLDLQIMLCTVPFQGLTLLIISFLIKRELVSISFLINMFLSIPLIIVTYELLSKLHVENKIAYSFCISTIFNSLISYLIFYFAKTKYNNSLL